MRLADFIDTHVEAIADAAEAFAATLLPAATHLDREALRDHPPLILKAVAADLRTPQTVAEQRAKSEGRGPCLPEAPETAAQTHALLRARVGFRIEQRVAEYRALRAGVLRLWGDSEYPLDAQTLADMVRFNEAIDQAVAESVAFYTTEVDRWGHLFLGVLGHDLRSPLNAILPTSQLLSRLATGEPARCYTTRLVRSGERMKALLDDLLDYNRASLGLGIAIRRAPADLAAACEEEVELLRSALPGQAVGLCVANEGATMPAAALEALFEPLRRGGVESRDEPAQGAHLGLGLFIVREIARAHGSEVEVASSQGWTTFTLALPRSNGATQAAG